MDQRGNKILEQRQQYVIDMFEEVYNDSLLSTKRHDEFVISLMKSYISTFDIINKMQESITNVSSMPQCTILDENKHLNAFMVEQIELHDMLLKDDTYFPRLDNKQLKTKENKMKSKGSKKATKKESKKTTTKPASKPKSKKC